MKAAVQWKEDMVFMGNPDSGHSVQMDADPYFGGTDQGVRPMEMIALGLAGCTAMDVLSILRKKRQRVTQFEVRVHAPRSAEHPKVFTGARITYSVTGNEIDETAVLRSIELSMTKYCPVQVMLSQAFPLELHYEIFEPQPDGSRRMTFQGMWEEFPSQ